MTASRTDDKALPQGEDKSLRPGEDKVATRGLVQPALDPPVDPALLASSEPQEDLGKVRVRFLHYTGDYKPNQHKSLPVAEANDFVTAGVAALDPK